MKSLKKRIVSMGIALALALGCCSVAGVQQTQAAGKSYMDSLNLKELKVNAKHKMSVKLAKNDNRDWKFTYYIKDLQKTDAKKKGYKKLTYTYVVEANDIKLTNTQIHKLCNGEMELNDVFFSTIVVDSETGKDLSNNDIDVKVTSTDWKYKRYKAQWDQHECGQQMMAKASEKVTVVYPETYKNLGIIVCLWKASEKSLKADDKFDNGKAVFGDTSFYKNDNIRKNVYYKKIK